MRQLALVFISAVFISSPVYAKGFRLLTPSQIQKIIGDYPVNGSAEETQDFDTLLHYQATRTEADCAEAKAEESASLAHFFAGKKGPLTEAEGKKWSLRIMAAYAQLGINVTVAKNMYKRPRPYNYNSQIVPCVALEGSYAYPSGHAMMARMFAHILGSIYPARKEALMNRADEVALNRVIGGVHHPSDVEAGKKMGDVLGKGLVANPAFMATLGK